MCIDELPPIDHYYLMACHWLMKWLIFDDLPWLIFDDLPLIDEWLIFEDLPLIDIITS